MKFTEFKRYLSGENLGNIYMLVGEDAFFLNRGEDMLAEKFVTEPQLNLTVFEGDAALADFGAVTAALDAYPFMSDKRMVVLREFYPKSEFIEKKLKSYLDDPSAYTILLIKNTKRTDGFKKYTDIVQVDCGKSDIDVLCRWIRSTCGKRNVGIGVAEAEKIAEYSLRDMMKIAGETEKLIVYAQPKGVITGEDVDALVTKDTEYQIYEMTDYLCRRNYDKALSVVKEMTAKGEPPQRLFVSMYNYFRRLLHIALSTESDAELAKRLSVKEFAVKKSREQAARFKKKSLKNAVDYFEEFDYKCKSGQSDFQSALNVALFKVLI